MIKNFFLALFLGYGIFSILFVVIYKGGNLFEDLSKSFTTKEKVSSIKDLSSRKLSIKERSDEIFNSKLNEAKIEGVSILELSDGSITTKTDYGDFRLGNLVNFSAKIKYDDFTDQYQCRKNYQSVDPISKDIKIPIGTCTENSIVRCSGKGKFDNYIQYRVNDEKEIRQYKPELVMEFIDGRGFNKYDYYQVLPYSFFKDFEKIALRYNYINENPISPNNNYKKTKTSKFDINSVLLINNFQKRCGIKKSIF